MHTKKHRNLRHAFDSNVAKKSELCRDISMFGNISFFEIHFISFGNNVWKHEFAQFYVWKHNGNGGKDPIFHEIMFGNIYRNVWKHV